jgi:hypothetical protein
MLFRRSIRNLNSLSLSVAALAVSASTLAAQGRPLFEWTGRVDREVRIAMHGRDARTLNSGRVPAARSRLAVETALPQRDGRVTVRVQDGRGDVDVVQQPSSRNDYTAIVRVVDRSSGVDNYRITAYWMPDESRNNNGNGPWNGRDNYPNRPGQGRHDDRGGWGNNGRNNDYDRDVVRWSGDVDDALEIRIQGNRIDYRTLSGKALRNVRADFSRNGGLPRRDVQVAVTDLNGRGSVSVVQQPSSHNNYTAVIRVYDPRPGYGGYDFDIAWRDNYSRR